MVVSCLLNMGGFALMPFDFMYDSSWPGISARVSFACHRRNNTLKVEHTHAHTRTHTHHFVVFINYKQILHDDQSDTNRHSM